MGRLLFERCSLLLAAALALGCGGSEPEPVQQVHPHDLCQPDEVTGLPLECCQLLRTSIFDDTEDIEGWTDPPSAWPDQASWWSSVTGRTCEQAVTMGHCANGHGFVAISGIDGELELRVFTASGAFVSLQMSHDYLTDACGATTYWPEVIDCERYTVEQQCLPQ